MPAKSITDAFVRNVKLPKKDDRPNQVPYFDKLERGLSLVLVVSYGGSKVFRAVTYNEMGKPKTIKLGSYPTMTVKAAREAARKHWADPAKYAAETAPDTVKAVGDKWLKLYVEAEGLIKGKDLKRQLEKYVYPRIGDRKFVDLKRSTISDLLDEVAIENGKGMAGCLRATLSMLCRWYEDRNDYYVSPVARRKTKRNARSRILEDQEIRDVWAACDKVQSKVYGAAIKLALLTGQRREKIASMKRSDVVDGVWSVRRENAREKGRPPN